MNKKDVDCINDIIKKIDDRAELGIGFCSSYKRLLVPTKGGEHSPALDNIRDLILSINKRECDKIIMHYSASNKMIFLDEIRNLLEYNELNRYIDIIFLSGEWYNARELMRIKELYKKIKIAIQLPVYRMDNTSISDVCCKLLEYVNVIDYASIDNSGGKGVEIDCNYSIELMNAMKKYDLDIQWLITGGLCGENIKKIVREVYLGTSIKFSVDAESKLRKAGDLCNQKVEEYVCNAIKSYKIILNSKGEYL